MINDDIIIYDHLYIYCIFLHSSNAVSLHTHCNSYCRGKTECDQHLPTTKPKTCKFTFQILEDTKCLYFLS